MILSYLLASVDGVYLLYHLINHKSKLFSALPENKYHLAVQPAVFFSLPYLFFNFLPVLVLSIYLISLNQKPFTNKSINSFFGALFFPWASSTSPLRPFRPLHSFPLNPRILLIRPWQLCEIRASRDIRSVQFCGVGRANRFAEPKKRSDWVLLLPPSTSCSFFGSGCFPFWKRDRRVSMGCVYFKGFNIGGLCGTLF